MKWWSKYRHLKVPGKANEFSREFCLYRIRSYLKFEYKLHILPRSPHDTPLISQLANDHLIMKAEKLAVSPSRRCLEETGTSCLMFTSPPASAEEDLESDGVLILALRQDLWWEVMRYREYCPMDHTSRLFESVRQYEIEELVMRSATNKFRKDS